jgi:hypothetical protein
VAIGEVVVAGVVRILEVVISASSTPHAPTTSVRTVTAGERVELTRSTVAIHGLGMRCLSFGVD